LTASAGHEGGQPKRNCFSSVAAATAQQQQQQQQQQPLNENLLLPRCSHQAK